VRKIGIEGGCSQGIVGDQDGGQRRLD